MIDLPVASSQGKLGATQGKSRDKVEAITSLHQLLPSRRLNSRLDAKSNTTKTNILRFLSRKVIRNDNALRDWTRTVM